MSSENGGASARDAAADDRRSAALDLFARRYGQVLARFFTRRVENRSDVGDLVQDVFLRLSKLNDLSVIDKPEHYLFATAASALQDQRRRDAARRRAQDPFAEDADSRSEIAPDRVLEGRQKVDRLRAALGELPERTRDVFVLRAFEERKMAEIARLMGISQRAVEKHYARAMAYLVGQLRDRGDD